MPTPVVRILLIGFRPMLADALQLLFRAEGSIEVLGAVLDSDELPASTLSAVNVLIFDARTTSELSTAIRWWKRRSPCSRMIAVDVDQENASVEWVAGGLDGFAVSHASTAELLEVIHRSVRGEAIVPYPFLTKVMERIRSLSGRTEGDYPPLKLTRRESAVLHLMAQGLSNKEIAVKLDISLFTVKNHVHSVLEKMKVRYRRQAIRCALDFGLLRPGAPVVFRHSMSGPVGVS